MVSMNIDKVRETIRLGRIYDALAEATNTDKDIVSYIVKKAIEEPSLRKLQEFLKNHSDDDIQEIVDRVFSEENLLGKRNLSFFYAPSIIVVNGKDFYTKNVRLYKEKFPDFDIKHQDCYFGKNKIRTYVYGFYDFLRNKYNLSIDSDTFYEMATLNYGSDTAKYKYDLVFPKSIIDIDFAMDKVKEILKIDEIVVSVADYIVENTGLNKLEELKTTLDDLHTINEDQIKYECYFKVPDSINMGISLEVKYVKKDNMIKATLDCFSYTMNDDEEPNRFGAYWEWNGPISGRINSLILLEKKEIDAAIEDKSKLESILEDNEDLYESMIDVKEWVDTPRDTNKDYSETKILEAVHKYLPTIPYSDNMSGILLYETDDIRIRLNIEVKVDLIYVSVSIFDGDCVRVVNDHDEVFDGSAEESLIEIPKICYSILHCDEFLDILDYYGIGEVDVKSILNSHGFKEEAEVCNKAKFSDDIKIDMFKDLFSSKYLGNSFPILSRDDILNLFSEKEL